MTTSGAPAALHGYRVQALYSLKRILTQPNDGRIFRLEGIEDLDVLSAEGHLLELVQVKKYSPLQLSDLEPANPNCFFRRALDKLTQYESLVIKLVNFGSFSRELQNAWDGQQPDQEMVERKLRGHGYTTEQIANLFALIELIELNETLEEVAVNKLLGELHVGIDAANGLDLLHYWLFKSMESRDKVVYADLREKLNSVGQWLAARRDYHAQWFTTIKPVEPEIDISSQDDALRNEFYEGRGSRFDHIVADLDFARNDKLLAIKAGFDKYNVVIVHAASGQGKTTLALRYLHDFYPNNWRFSITRIENVQIALAAANALDGYARAIRVPTIVHLDVYPQDIAWVEFVRQLARHPYLQILVTIREEDYSRATTANIDFDYEPLDLIFTEQEARFIFERARIRFSQERFLNFAAAWDSFGGQGPLLEFVYLLTQTESLRQRLGNQIAQIKDKVHAKQLVPAELKLLRLVAVATAFEARVSTRKVIDILNLPEPATTLEYYQNEFLIRVKEAGYIEGLHAIRSTILVELLTDLDLNLWIDLAREVLGLLVEEDVELFILSAAVKHPAEFDQLRYTATQLRPVTWRGIASVLRGLLWADINAYVAMSKPAIDAAREEFGAGWYFIANLNLPHEDTPAIENWWERDGLSALFPARRRKRLTAIQAMLPPKGQLFIETRQWLVEVATSPKNPTSQLDWSGLAFTLYWAAYLNVSHFVPPQPDIELPLFVLAEIAYALSKYAPHQHAQWLAGVEPHLLTRLADELSILCLEGHETLLTVHFVVLESEIGRRQDQDPFHAAAMERLQLVRQLYPAYEKYGIQGYGHKLGETLQLDWDSTFKSGIERSSLVPELVTWANGVATGIARYKLRPETWLDFAHEIVKRRRIITTCFGQLREGLIAYVSSRKPANIVADYIRVDVWSECHRMLTSDMDLPKPAVDPWGFASETQTDNHQQEPNKRRYLPQAIAQRAYQPYLQTQRDFFRHIETFIRLVPCFCAK